VKPI